MRRFLSISFVFILFSQTILAQDFYWVAFTDKNNSAFSLNNPQEYLSERAIQRRVKQHILIDSLDLPVNKNYIDSVVNIGVTLVLQSKWLNGITVKSELVDFENKVAKFPFVKEFQRTKPAVLQKSAHNKFSELNSAENEPIDTSCYGPSVFQTSLLNGQFLHNQNFLGQGIVIAVLDAGFLKTNIYPAFDSLWANGQILGTKDFVHPNSDFFDTHYHGMSVLSCMGGNVRGEIYGTAPNASYWLLRSEDANSEYIIEEDNWVVAAEFADSVGADIINSSLGYHVFDDDQTSHTFSDMDGKTTRVTRGANIAAARGMLVFSSAGNEGNDPWKKIIAPSDGDLVIGVGAVDKNGVPAAFSSFGPASDGDVKPNVAALGWNTYLQKSTGVFDYANGTSFSSPVLAGMAACLWQSIPYATAAQVKDAIQFSAHLIDNPHQQMGYGIPDFKKAWISLFNMSSSRVETNNKWVLFPNPVSDYFTLQNKSGIQNNTVKIELFSFEGKGIQSWEKPSASMLVFRNLHDLSSGMYLLRIVSGNSSETLKLNKVN